MMIEHKSNHFFESSTSSSRGSKESKEAAEKSSYFETQTQASLILTDLNIKPEQRPKGLSSEEVLKLGEDRAVKRELKLKELALDVQNEKAKFEFEAKGRRIAEEKANLATRERMAEADARKVAEEKARAAEEKLKAVEKKRLELEMIIESLKGQKI